MSDSDKETVPPSEEQQYLRRSLRRIIIGQEIGPRAPRWRAAWKRTLIGYVDRLDQLSARSKREIRPRETVDVLSGGIKGNE